MQFTSHARKAALVGAVAATAALFGLEAQAATISGTWNGLTWTAESRIVGQTSTATAAGGGDPIYFPKRPFHNGVVALIMDEGAAGTFICSGSLLSDRRSVLTAGHCVSHGAGTSNPVSTTAYFYGGPNPDSVPPADPSATAIDVTKYAVNPDYTGEVIDENDIAVLTLAQAAPDWATSYDLFTGGLAGQEFNVAGYGARSDAGGAVGADLNPGRLRQGDNVYDFALGDPDFAGIFTPGFFGEPAGTEIGNSWLADFDNGSAANDASCVVAGLFGLGGPKYCNTGLGAIEVDVAGGDSGGPQFINGKIASITSYGLSFGKEGGDIDDDLNSTWGEFSGFVPVSIHQDFIRNAMVPEPTIWALLILGFGLTGAVARRRRTAIA